MVEVDFELLEPEAITSFEPLPPGWYPATVKTTEKATSKNGHEYLLVEFEITGADYAGRRVWENLNLWHPTESTQKRGQRIYSDLVRACGRSNCKHTEALHGLHLDVLLKIEKGTDGYADKNKTSAFRTAPAATLAPSLNEPMAVPSNGNAASLDDQAEGPELPW